MDSTHACGGEANCWAWRFTDDGVNTKIRVKVFYKVKRNVCINCPNGVDFSVAHQQWQEAKERTLGQEQEGCPTFSDPSPQELRTGFHYYWDKLVH